MNASPHVPVHTSLSRRDFLRGAAALGVYAGLAACGSGSGSGSGGGEGTLSVQDSFSNASTHTLLVKYAREFEKANSGVKVQVTAVPWDNHRTSLLAALSAGTLPDVIHSSSAFGSVEFSQLGAFQDVAGLMPDKFRNNFVEGSFEEIGTLGIPIDMAPEEGIWYLKAAFDDAGITPPPVNEAWSWDEMLAAAKKLTRSGQWGFCERGGSAVMSKSVIPYAWSYGGDFVTGSDGSWKSGVASDAVKAAMQLDVDLTRVHKVRPASYLNWGLAEAQQAWSKKQMAMFSSGMWWAANADQVSPLRFGKDYDVMLFPTDDPSNKAVYTGHDYFHVAKDTEKAELAMRFIQFVLQKDRMIALGKDNLNLPPMTKDALADPYYSTENYPVFGSRYKEWVPLQRTLNTNPHYGDIVSTLVVPTVQTLVQSGNPVNAAMDKLDPQVEAKLAA